jgi:NTE family protein
VTRRDDPGVGDLVTQLADISLFALFSRPELEMLASRCTERDYTKGATIWRAGAAGTELLLVIDGELTVWGSGSTDVVTRLGPGSTVGEMALLLDEPRSATVTATRDTRVATLGRDDFEASVKTDHRAIRALSEVLSRRLAATTTRQVAPPLSLIVAVVSGPGQVGASLIAACLRHLLGTDTGLQVLGLEVTDDGAPLGQLSSGDVQSSIRRGAVLTGAREESTDETLSALSSLLARLSRHHPIVVLDVPARAELPPEVLARVADVIVVLDGHPPDGFAGDQHTRVLRVHNCADRSLALPSPTTTFDLGRVDDICRLPPPRAASLLLGHRRGSATLGRLVRAIERRVIGVALGAGAALGLAHIGVLRELERAGIPVDVLCGSSMGAVVALGYGACGCASGLEEAAHTRSSLLRLLGTVDLATTGDGVLSGSRLLSYLRPFLQGAESFDDLTLPTRAVATDLSTARPVAIADGRLEDAVRATIAMPPFITPVLEGGRVLVDGGISCPVPFDAAKEMGADIVIAVNVIPPPDVSSATILTRLTRGINRLNPLAYWQGRLDGRNLADIMMHSYQIVEHELGRHQAQLAEVVVEPDVGRHTWIEFYQAPAIIERGAVAAQAAIPRLREVLQTRLADSVPLRTRGARPI